MASDDLDRYGNQVVLGYKLEIVLEEATVVIMILKYYAENEWTTLQIADKLNKQLSEIGFPKLPKGKLCSASTISGILSNKIYETMFGINKSTE